MKKTVEQIQQQRRDFVHRIALNIMEHKIPPELVVNLDQTGLHLAPVSNSTFASKGSKQVVVRFSQDKRQVTALLSGSASGVMLPSQIIFKGTFFGSASRFTENSRFFETYVFSRSD